MATATTTRWLAGASARCLPHAYWVPWGGVRYGYYGGVWYAPYGGGYVVARPPYGVVVATLPTFATVVTLGGLGYWYANGAYYREYAGGGYEVVPSPIVGVPDGSGAIARTYVYPKLGQTAEKQASDEYECHRWAVNQTGFDPTAAATGQSTAPPQRSDYARPGRLPRRTRLHGALTRRRWPSNHGSRRGLSAATGRGSPRCARG